MRRFLLVVLLFVKAFSVLCFESETKSTISSIFESLGYSPACVASSLASCELSSISCNKKNVSETLAKLNVSVINSKFDNIRARNCDELLKMGDMTSGVRSVYPYDCCKDRKVFVFCDQTIDGGGWTVIHNRDSLPEREDFYRTWVEYALGFGNVSGEYWLGLDSIHALVATNLMEMRIDLEDYDGVKKWVKYGAFYIGDAASKYILSMGRYTGDAGDDLSGKSGMKFSTHDQDNDTWEKNCSKDFRGAGWYSNCHAANLNGYQYVGAHTSYADGINWASFRGHNYSLKKASMKVRTVFRQE